MNLLSRGAQISLDKNVNIPCTSTLPPEPTGFVVLCQLTQELSLPCGFCPPDQARGRLYSHDSVFLRTVGRPPALAFGSYFC